MGRCTCGECSWSALESLYLALTPLPGVGCGRDPRRAKGPVASLPASEKVYTLDVREYKLVVGTSDRSVLIYDAR